MRRALFILILSAGAIFINLLYISYSGIEKNSRFIEKAKNIPYNIDGWQAKDLPITEQVYKDIQTYDAILREYTNPAYKFSVIVYTVFSSGKNPFHPPEYCYIGVGEDVITRKQAISIPAGNRKVPLTVLKLRSRRKQKEFYVFYWFMNKNLATNNYYLQRILGVFSRLGFMNSPWIMVRAAVYFHNVKEEEIFKQVRLILQKIYISLSSAIWQ